MSGKVAVYALVDPREPERIRYIGSTQDPKHRLHIHCAPSSVQRHTKSGQWIDALRADGLKPEMKILSWHNPEDAANEEYDLYHRLMPSGHLLNQTTPRRRGMMTSRSHIRKVERKVVGRLTSAYVSIPGEWLGKRVEIRLLDDPEMQGVLK